MLVCPHMIWWVEAISLRRDETDGCDGSKLSSVVGLS